jgi:transmembrane sensor
MSISPKKIDKDVYLLPGQQVIYSKLYASTTVSAFKEIKINNRSLNGRSDHKEVDSSNDNLVILNGDKTPWYMFNNQSLPVVFEQLKEMYGVDITYSRRQVANMYFIGKFNKSDSVETILEQIGKLNNLKVKRQNMKYIITK